MKQKSDFIYLFVFKSHVNFSRRGFHAGCWFGKAVCLPVVSSRSKRPCERRALSEGKKIKIK